MPSNRNKFSFIKRFFFHIAFNGLQYHGWQRQISALGVQEVIENTLSKVLKEPVTISGCGRTDAMVHASQYFFHTDLREELDFDLKTRLNHNLPDDITVFDLIPVSDNAHARFDAQWRTYDYFIHREKDPFLAGRSACYPFWELDLGQMRAAVDLLPQHENYYAFCRSPDKLDHTNCRVQSAHLWVNPDGSRLRFKITANRFLRGMVRIIVGQLLELGKSKITLQTFESYLTAGQSLAQHHAAHPQGLYLSKVVYPDFNLPARSECMLMPYEDEGRYWSRVAS